MPSSKKFKCEKCPYEAPQCLLNIHIMGVHDKIKNHVCEVCEAAFTVKKDLRKHEKAVHLKIKEHDCNICGLAFSHRGN